MSVKALIRNAEGKLLMIKEGSDDWGIPGGGLDHGETIEQGMRREIKEELGATMASMSDLPVLVAPYFYEPLDRWRLWLVYEVELSSEAKVGQDATAISWFSPADFPTLKLDDTEIEGVHDVFKLV